MRPFRTVITTAGAGIAAVALASLAAASPAAAAPVGKLGVTTDSVRAAAGWLTTQFVGANHLPSATGDHFDSKYGSDYYANYGENADVIFGLAAAKSGSAKISTALDYLASNADGYANVSGAAGTAYDGSVAKLAVAAIVAGRDPKAFAGHDLIAILKADECGASSTTCTPGSAANIYSGISESFVILAEARTGGSSAPSDSAMNYLLTLQCATSGGFTSGVSACAAGDEDIDATSYAIMALKAAGGHTAELARATAWLEAQRTSGGYWVSQGVPNTNSTGLAAAALQGADVDVSTSRAWLRSQQVSRGKVGAGALKYAGSVEPTTTAATSLSVLATAQGLTGLVDGGGLATLTAADSTSGASVFAPTSSLTAHSVRSGSSDKVTGHGFAAGEKVRVSVHSKAVTVKTVQADPLGSITSSFTVPISVTAGAHSVELQGLTSGLTASSPLTVTVVSPSSSEPVASTTSAPLAATGRDSRTTVDLAVLGVLAMIAGLGLTFLGRARRHS